MTCNKNSLLKLTKNRIYGSMPETEENSRKTGFTAEKPRIYDWYGILTGGESIWRVLGIFPLTIKQSMGTKKYGINKYYAVYSVLIFLTCAINFIYIVSSWRKDDLNMVTINVVLQTFSCLLCMFVAIILRIFRHNELSKLIKMMAEQGFMLQKMNCRLNYESDVKAGRAYVWTTTMVATFLVGYNFLISKGMIWSENVKWIFWCIPMVVQTLDLTIFVSLVGLLGLQFRALNERMKAVAIRANESSPKVIATSDVCAENLQIIAKSHYNICDVGKRINSFFNLDVIINVITAFIILSTTLYYIFVEVQRQDEADYLRIGRYVQWEVIYGFPIIGVVMTCNWTSNQANQAEKLIHEIRVNKVDSRLYESVKSFSLQLHHQNLEFNACGFFPLNSTLVQTIVGNIATYLVILIQFQPKIDYLSRPRG